jgi:hypothetical protein
MAIPEPARSKLERQLNIRRQERWPALRDLTVRYRADFAYITGADDDDPLTLCRLRYTGSPDECGFACYLASKDGYEDSILPSGSFTGTPEQASTAPAASTSTTHSVGRHPTRFTRRLVTRTTSGRVAARNRVLGLGPEMML